MGFVTEGMVLKRKARLTSEEVKAELRRQPLIEEFCDVLNLDAITASVSTEAVWLYSWKGPVTEVTVGASEYRVTEELHRDTACERALLWHLRLSEPRTASVEITYETCYDDVTCEDKITASIYVTFSPALDGSTN